MTLKYLTLSTSVDAHFWTKFAQLVVDMEGAMCGSVRELTTNSFPVVDYKFTIPLASPSEGYLASVTSTVPHSQ